MQFGIRTSVLFAVIFVVSVSASVEPAVAEDGGGVVLHVDDDATPGGDGLAWETAYKYLQDALAYAFFHPEVDEIRVAQGMYFPDRSDALPEGSGARNVSFDMLNGLSLNGGYRGCPGGDCTDADDRDVEVFETILSGEIGDLEVTTDNSYHVVVGTGTDATAVIDGFTITAGRADGSAPHDDGAGLYVNGGSPVVAYCEFAGNYATLDGGGVYYVGEQGGFSLVGCRFSGNWCGVTGGGAVVENVGAVNMFDCQFLENTSNGNAGAGLAVTQADSVVVTDCTFLNNSAHNRGAGLYSNNAGLLELIACDFEGNVLWTGNSDQGLGGGVHCGDDIVAVDCTFAGNSANSAGNYVGGSARGGAIHAFGSIELTDCTFSDNTAQGNDGNGDWKGMGGAVFTSQAVTATDCVFTNNLALAWGWNVVWSGRGGAISTNDAHFERCTFTGNRAVYSDTDEDEGCAQGGAVCTTILYAHDCEFVENEVVHAGEWRSQGGAVYAAGTTLTDCSFTGNIAIGDGDYDGYGGAVYAHDGTTAITNCDFNDNSAEYQGGALYLHESSDTIRDCHFTGNSTTDAGGGAIFGYQNGGVIQDCVFEYNMCNGHGGAIRQGGVFLNLERCTFLVNSAGSWGGALYHDGDSDHITDCFFMGNSADVNGGAILMDEGCSPTISRCVFDDNHADEYGGALAIFDGSNPTVANSIFKANLADIGGGAVYFFNAGGLLRNSTCHWNTAGWNGGAVFNDSSAVEIRNCILWDDEAPSWSEIHGMQTIINYSDVEGGWPGTNNMNEDPLFGDGGRLLADSPCIDAGDPDFVESYPGETDVHGLVRVWDGDDDGDWIVDMGACEFGSYPYGDCNCDGAVTFDDILPFIRALDGELTYYSHYPDCRRLNADANGDGAVTFDDIQPFVGLF